MRHRAPTVPTALPTPVPIAVEEELFAPDRMERLDADSLDAGLRALVSRHPDAPIAAMKADGVCVPVPATIGLAQSPALEARSGLDLVIHEDRVRLLATWDSSAGDGRRDDGGRTRR